LFFNLPDKRECSSSVETDSSPPFYLLFLAFLRLLNIIVKKFGLLSKKNFFSFYGLLK